MGDDKIKKLIASEKDKGDPVLKLHCIESYSNPGTNRELFTRNYVYHVFTVGRDFIKMQTNFPGEEAEVPMKIVKRVFAGFGRQNSDAIKSI